MISKHTQNRNLRQYLTNLLFWLVNSTKQESQAKVTSTTNKCFYTSFVEDDIRPTIVLSKSNKHWEWKHLDCPYLIWFLKIDLRNIGHTKTIDCICWKSCFDFFFGYNLTYTLLLFNWKKKIAIFQWWKIHHFEKKKDIDKYWSIESAGTTIVFSLVIR